MPVININMHNTKYMDALYVIPSAQYRCEDKICQRMFQVTGYKFD